MKRFLSLTIIVISLIGVARAQDIVNLRMDAQWEGLRGSVSSMDEDVLLRSDDFREDWPSRKWFRGDIRKILPEASGRVLTFNPSGRLLTVTYTYNGKERRKTTCTYASNGLLASYLGEGYKVEAKYNAATADINIYTESKRYSTLNDLSHDELSKVPFRTTYPFDMKCTQKLSSSGLILRSEYHYVDNVTLRVCNYTYNHNDQLIKEQILDYTKDPSRAQQTIVEYTYDQYSFLTRKTIKSPSVDDVYDYVNNDKGDCVKLTITRPYETLVFTYVYEYDDQDNWVMRQQYLDGKFDRVVLRTFTYHKKNAKATTVALAGPDNPIVKQARQENDKAIAEARAAYDQELQNVRKAKTEQAIADQEAAAAESAAQAARKVAKQTRSKSAEASAEAAEKVAKEAR